MGKGRGEWMSLRAAKVRRWALLRGSRGKIQPEATSVAVSVGIYWPEVACPQWWTVSIWMKPGAVPLRYRRCEWGRLCQNSLAHLYILVFAFLYGIIPLYIAVSFRFFEF
jgi:hypothetical protein